MLNNLTGTITPWILGTLLLLMLLAMAIVIKSWYEMKRSPYFFMRRQAEKRLQTYSFASLGLILATTVTAAYTLQAPVDTTPLVAVLVNAKPASPEIQALIAASSVELDTVSEAGDYPQIISTTDTNPLALGDTAELLQAVRTLPAEFDRFEPKAELSKATQLGQLAFSTQITDDYEAVTPKNRFNAGSYTLYATFSYEGMADGMEWAWVWRRDGEVLEGGNELWDYGADGPGYIYYNPEEGFAPGEYTLEVWVNGELLTESRLSMTGTALSSGN